MINPWQNAIAQPTTPGMISSYVPIVGSSIANASTDFTFTTLDGIRGVKVTTAASLIQVNLPPLATNFGRIIIIQKVDAGAGTINLVGNASETIDGINATRIISKFGCLILQANTSDWNVIAADDVSIAQTSGVEISTTPSGNWIPIVGLNLPSGVWELSGMCIGRIASVTGFSAFETGFSSSALNKNDKKSE